MIEIEHFSVEAISVYPHLLYFWFICKSNNSIFTNIQMIYVTKIENSKRNEFGIKFFLGVIYTTRGNMYIRITVMKTAVNPYVHLVISTTSFPVMYRALL